MMSHARTVSAAAVLHTGQRLDRRECEGRQLTSGIVGLAELGQGHDQSLELCFLLA
jgi:hypothetical protein